jgi:hypothetical protein
VAQFIASGTMAVAYMQFHWKFQLDENALPATNGGELAVVQCSLFLFIACQGRSSKSPGGAQRDVWPAHRWFEQAVAHQVVG